MGTPIKTQKRTDSSKLTRNDWLDAAFNAVVEGGFDHVRVLALAQTLGVTRGSFYWHFTDHADLIAALLKRWREQEAASEQLLQAAITDDPQADLEQLLEAALAHAGTDLENMRFELALRGLGRRDPAVAILLVDVDRTRLRLFESKFHRLTGDAKVAADLAALFYLAIVGSNQALSRPANPPQTKDYLKAIIGHYFIHRTVP
jgi:AcrR family transcriptional regulator